MEDIHCLLKKITWDKAMEQDGNELIPKASPFPPLS